MQDFVISKFLYQNGYFAIPQKNLELQLISHPDYPSIKAITDTLDYFKIENVAVSLHKQSLDKLPKLFIALMNISEGNNIVSVLKRKNDVILHFDGGVKKIFNTKNFMESWTGTLIAVEESQGKRKIVYNSSVILILIVIVSLFAIQFASFRLATFLLSFLSQVGTFLSYIIIKEELGLHSKIASKVCGEKDSIATCADVINSANSKLFGIVSLSDMTVTFFVGFALIYVLLGFNYSFTLVVLSISLPIVLYPLYQQAFILKKWCMLCLGVVVILIGQGVITLLNNESIKISIEYSLQAFFILTFVFTVWHYVKPALADQHALIKTKFEFLRFKRNQNIFQALLHQNPLRFPDSIIDGDKMMFGAKDPIVTIDAVTNPMCGFCADAFKAYDELIKRHKNAVRINLIFNVPVQRLDSSATMLADKMIKIFDEHGTSKAWSAIREWYKNQNIEQWQSQFGVLEKCEETRIKSLRDQERWCITNKIKYTPTTVIDGHIYPREYRISDLPILVSDLIVEKNAISIEELTPDRYFLQE